MMETIYGLSPRWAGLLAGLEKRKDASRDRAEGKEGKRNVQSRLSCRKQDEMDE